jgi:hypothetical protein
MRRCFVSIFLSMAVVAREGITAIQAGETIILIRK